MNIYYIIPKGTWVEVTTGNGRRYTRTLVRDFIVPESSRSDFDKPNSSDMIYIFLDNILSPHLRELYFSIRVNKKTITKIS